MDILSYRYRDILYLPEFHSFYVVEWAKERKPVTY